jgi:manganese-dependent ADP-ribose/CDP-alcohol diphosphatase
MDRHLIRLAACLLGLLAAGCVLTRPAASPTGPLFTFAVIADIQYADKPAWKEGGRYFRESLDRLGDAVAVLNADRPAFAIQLGDIIDGRDTPANSVADLDRVLAVYGRIRVPHYHVLGNHCLAAGGRNALLPKLGLRRAYYDFTNPAAPGWRFLVLDGNDPGTSPAAEPQLRWLTETLARASARKERIVIFSHFALLAEAAPYDRMSQPEPVLSRIEQAGCVVAYFAGHEHGGGYAFRNGIHHVTMQSMVNAPKDGAWGTVEVYADRLRLVGHGSQPSMTLSVAPGERLKLTD